MPVSDKFKDAYIPTRSLQFYTLCGTIPLIIISACLLATNLSAYYISFLTAAGAGVSLFALSKLLYELSYDIIGDPNYKLPVWSVLYLIVYLVLLFTFVFFTLHTWAPKQFFRGFGSSNPRTTFIDALYISLSNYVNTGVNTSISDTGKSSLYLSLLESIIGMFINLVIITKFVSSF
jgi:hypothetical protein